MTSGPKRQPISRPSLNRIPGSITGSDQSTSAASLEVLAVFSCEGGRQGPVASRIDPQRQQWNPEGHTGSGPPLLDLRSSPRLPTSNGPSSPFRDTRLFFFLPPGAACARRPASALPEEHPLRLPHRPLAAARACERAPRAAPGCCR